MRFSARIDAWAVCVIAVGALAAIGVGIFFIYIAGGEWVGGCRRIVMVLAGVAMFSSLVLSGYEITSSHVVLWPLPLRLIRIDEIVEAVSVNSISATLHVASSSQAIRITGSRKFCGVLPPTESIDRSQFANTRGRTRESFRSSTCPASQRR